jgi:hypothetical protein
MRRSCGLNIFRLAGVFKAAYKMHGYALAGFKKSESPEIKASERIDI